jgi:hypothetical protein
MPLMRRRPLLRAAAVGGGAYYMGKRQAEAQEREQTQEARLSGLESQTYAAPPPQAAAPPPQPATGLTPDAMNQLTQLGQLHDQGILTDEEFAAQKAKLLGS